MKRKIEKSLLCQPDNLRGCSVCCGLFNHHDISRESLTLFLEEGSIRSKTQGPVAIPKFHAPDRNLVRDVTAHICPFQGFIVSNRPGCLVHEFVAGHDRREDSLFGKKVCDEFLCPAHEIITGRYREILLDTVQDWYLYSFAIADPDSFIWICDRAMDARGHVAGEAILAGLEKHADYLSRRRGPLFFYGMTEYRQARRNFSLAFCGSQCDSVREEVLAAVKQASCNNPVSSES